MSFGARVTAAAVLQLAFAASVFAGDAKPSSDSTPAAAITAAPESPAPPPAAQATPLPQRQASSDSMRGPDTPAFELYLGYAYVKSNTKVGIGGGQTAQEHFDFIPGGVGEVSGNVNNWLGLVADFGGYGLHDVANVDARLWTYTFGPRFYLTRGKFTPFVHVLAGGARLKSEITPGSSTDTFTFAAPVHKNSFAALPGGGADLTLGRHLAIRLFQIEYLLTKFSDGAKNRQNNFRASTGLVFRMKYPEAPPPPLHPPTMACTANPDTVHAETAEYSGIHADVNNPDNANLTFSWSASGGSVDGTGADVRWNPGNAAVGTYTVTGHVDDGRGNVANCAVPVHVIQRPNRPPTMSCSASANSTPAGQSLQITANASDPDGDPLTYSWQASGGRIVGSGAQVQFDSTGATPGHYTVTGTVSDGRGGLADCRIDLDVQKPQEQVQLENNLALHSIYFATAMPSTKNPTGGLLASQQRTLERLAADFTRYMKYRPDAHLVLRGHTDPRGSEEYNQKLSERRVGAAKAFLVAHGVPDGDIETEGVGKEQQLSAEDVKKLVDQDENLTAEQRARINKNMRTVVLAQNRRVDILLKSAEGTTLSIREYPFSSTDVLTLLAPSGPIRTVRGKKGAPAPAKKTGPRKTAPQKK
jgi:outer membrane protein OmpA-like peptidoglycan-associated protein/opacity protein-like surface antigen